MLGQLRRGDPLAQVLHLLALGLAEFRLDRLHLLAQEVLALRVGHLLLRGRFDLALDFEQLDLAGERGGHRRQFDRQAVLFEEELLVLDLHVDQRRDQVDEAQRFVDAGDDRAQLGRQAGRDTEGAFDQFAEAADVRVHFHGAFGRRRFRQRCQRRQDGVLIPADIR